MSGSLVIVGAHPAEVTAALGLDPDRAWVAGERNTFHLPSGDIRELASVSERSGWKKFSPDDLVEPEQIVEYWVEFVRLRVSAFLTLPAATTASIEVLIQENQGLDITPEDLATLSSARVGLGITVQVMSDG